MLVITVCATASYCYAMFAQAVRVAANVAGWPPGVVLVAGDSSPQSLASVEHYREVMPEGWRVDHLILPVKDGHVNYKQDAQLVIAQMRTAVYARARKLGATLCWSLDSDVLPPPNALDCMANTLQFDHGYYGVASCPYPSQGGFAFLGGRGTPQQHILPDFYDDERQVPDELQARINAHREAYKAFNGVTPDKAWFDEREVLHAEIKKCPPIGDVWTCNSRKFRRRGWLDNAYPGIGKGAVLPSDWCGFGCTLMSVKALGLAIFDGYEGGGTEDLFVVWNRWYGAGVRINVVTHCPCDHIIRKRDKSGFIHQRTYHEGPGSETEGHLRVQSRGFYQGLAGEIYDPQNNGRNPEPVEQEQEWVLL